MANRQYYGIKYPFVTNDSENFFIDLNKSRKDYVRSLLMHIVFTPKGQKLRDPMFGTDLIKYIFEPSDGISWELVKNEVSEAVQKYIPNLTINDLQVLKNEENTSSIFVRLDYSIVEGYTTVEDSIVAEL